jgi:predicted nucleotidyltransferase
MSKPLEISLDAITIRMLHEMQAVFRELDIEYYIAGAFARDVQFQTKNSETFARRTNDIDLAVYVSNEVKYNALIEALVATGSFKRDRDEIIKLYYKLGNEVDLIPFGEIEDSKRVVRLTQPKVFILQMPGFAEAFPFIETVKSGDLLLNVCPVEGLIMLKLVSWDDRPGRTHDLEDIQTIIDAYFDWNADEIYQLHNDIFDQYDNAESDIWQSVIAAHIIGRKMKPMLEVATDLRESILKLLQTRHDPRWAAMRNGLNEH